MRQQSFVYLMFQGQPIFGARQDEISVAELERFRLVEARTRHVPVENIDLQFETEAAPCGHSGQ